jgi:DNA-directed RNA polymerase sigma subunit (sigma70/sigma32)
VIADDVIELTAARVHEKWMAAKRASGVTSRRSETGEELMVPYEQLSESAKDLDRISARTALEAYDEATSLPKDALEPLHRRVIELIPVHRSDKEIGRALGISRERVTQIIHKLAEKFEIDPSGDIRRQLACAAGCERIRMIGRRRPRPLPNG